MNGSSEKNLNLIVEETTDLENEYILTVKEDLTLVGIDETKDDQKDHFEIIPTSKPTPMSVPTVESMYIYGIELQPMYSELFLLFLCFFPSFYSF